MDSQQAKYHSSGYTRNYQRLAQHWLSLPGWQRLGSACVAALLLSMIVFSAFDVPKTKAVTDTFTSSGTWSVPAGVTSADFEAWGGGGAGGGSTLSNTGGHGGAGGQYAKKNSQPVNSGDVYTVTVAASQAGSTAAGSTGNDSQITDPSATVIVRAKGGAGGGASGGGSAGVGSTTNGIGDIVYAGGNGGGGSGGNSGGGGGGAGSTGAGGNASAATAGIGTANNGGNGGAGQTSSANGGAGSNYGGAGAGGFKTIGANRSGGAGAGGFVQITYTVTNAAPAAPTLSTPASGATGISSTPQFTFRTTDADNDYLRYKIVLYQSDCSTVVGTFDQTSSQTGWSGQDTQTSTAYAGNSTITSSTIATYTYQGSLSNSTTYCWKAAAIDPGGSNSFGAFSATQSFTTANAAPAAPTLSLPSNTATGVNITPTFQLRTTDAEGDYVRYKIEVCTTSNCSAILRTIDQTSSQTGWTGQDAQTNTAYVAASAIGSSTLASHTYQPTALSFSTQYWWRAYAIDPGGSNTWSSASSIFSFTTTAPTSNTYLNGGTQIRGGTRIGN